MVPAVVDACSTITFSAHKDRAEFLDSQRMLVKRGRYLYVVPPAVFENKFID